MLEHFICCLDLRNWNPFQFSPSFSKCHLQTWFLKIPTELLSFFCTIPLSLECSLQIPLVLLPNMVSLLGLGLGSCLGPTTLWYYPLVLEKEMATHSSTLAWKIPQTKEAGRLQSMGSQRVGYDWATSLSLSNFLPFEYDLISSNSCKYLSTVSRLMIWWFLDSTCNIHLCVWLLLVNIMFPRPIHIVGNGRIPLFKAE